MSSRQASSSFVEKGKGHYNATATANPNGEEKTGWLQKKGFKRRNWTRRYFRLEGRQLRYFAGESARKCKGLVPLRGVSARPSSHRTKKAALQGLYPFEIAHSHRRSFLLMAESASERDEWILRIRRASLGLADGPVDALPPLAPLAMLWLRVAMEHIDKMYLEAEGLYRLSGSKPVVDKLAEEFSAEVMDMVRPTGANLPDIDVNAICGAIKACLVKRFAPLLPYEMYDEIMDAGADAMKLRACIWRIDTEQRQFLHDLIKHLYRIVELQETNKMGAGNLATIFAVGLLRRSESLQDCISDIPRRIKIVSMLITHNQLVFSDDLEAAKAAGIDIPEDISALKVRELKELLSRTGVSFHGCTEKKELEDLVMMGLGRDDRDTPRGASHTASRGFAAGGAGGGEGGGEGKGEGGQGNASVVVAPQLQVWEWSSDSEGSIVLSDDEEEGIGGSAGGFGGEDAAPRGRPKSMRFGRGGDSKRASRRIPLDQVRAAIALGGVPPPLQATVRESFDEVDEVASTDDAGPFLAAGVSQDFPTTEYADAAEYNVEGDADYNAESDAAGGILHDASSSSPQTTRPTWKETAKRALERRKRDSLIDL